MRDIVPFINDIRKNVIGFDNLFDDLVHRDMRGFADSFPKDNVINLENTVIIELALAGYNREDIDISRDGNLLTISAEKQDREVDEGATYIRKNIAFRSFTKSYTVASEYKDIRARLKDGILSIHLEKEPQKSTIKTIEIS